MMLKYFLPDVNQSEESGFLGMRESLKNLSQPSLVKLTKSED